MMWDFPKKWLGLVVIIGTLIFLFFWKTNQQNGAIAHYNGSSSERCGEKK